MATEIKPFLDIPKKGAEIIVYFNEPNKVQVGPPAEIEMPCLFIAVKDGVLWVSYDGGAVGFPLDKVNEIDYGRPDEGDVS